jgi:hypothetical protein
LYSRGEHPVSRTAHLLAHMKKGDDAFNSRDFAAVDGRHHQDMVPYGLAKKRGINVSVFVDCVWQEAELNEKNAAFIASG